MCPFCRKYLCIGHLPRTEHHCVMGVFGLNRAPITWQTTWQEELNNAIGISAPNINFLTHPEQSDETSDAHIQISSTLSLRGNSNFVRRILLMLLFSDPSEATELTRKATKRILSVEFDQMSYLVSTRFLLCIANMVLWIRSVCLRMRHWAMAAHLFRSSWYLDACCCALSHIEGL